MVNAWTRDDMPHEHEVWDDFVAEMPGEVFGIVDQEDLGKVLDAVVAHLNAHHPKPGRDAEFWIDRWKDAAEENEFALDEMRRERDAAVARAEQAERERDAARDDDRLHAWGRITRHTFFYRCQFAAGELTDAMLAALDEAHQPAPAEARTAPAVSRADVAEALSRCLNPEMWNVTFPSVVNEVCDLFGVEAEQATDQDPVEDKARELYRVATPDARWETVADEYRRIARHVLGQEDAR